MELLKKYIGDIGRYQLYLYALLALPFTLSGIQVMAFTFTGAVPAHRCFLPGYDNPGDASYKKPFNANMTRLIYRPPTKERSKDAYCFYCPGAINQTFFHRQNGCQLQDQVPCTHGHVYDRSQFHSTLAAKFNMVCDDGVWKRSLASSFFMLGFLVGAAITGTLSDRFGRRPVFLGLSLLGMTTYHLIMLVPNLAVLYLFHLLNGAFCHGAYLTAFVIVKEYIGGGWGTICGIWAQSFFSFGYIYVGFCAYLIRDWQWLQFALSFSAIFLIPYYWLIPESIRWLITHGRKEEAKGLILKAARWNRLKINELELDRDIDEVTVSQNVTVVALFKDRSLAKVTLIIFYSWFATSMLFYGLILNTSDLPGNEYGTYVLMGVVDFPGYAIAVPMMEKWGRRPTCVVFFGLGGFAVIISAFLPRSLSWLIITLALVGKMGATASFAVIYNYSAELFPTVARNAGIGFSSSCARIASISAPQIYLMAHYVRPWVPFLIYGSASVLAALADIFLPETLGRALPETIEDGIAVANDVSYLENMKTFHRSSRVTPIDDNTATSHKLVRRRETQL